MTKSNTSPTTATFAKQIAVLMSKDQWETYRTDMMHAYNCTELNDYDLETLMIANGLLAVDSDHANRMYIGYDNMRSYV